MKRQKEKRIAIDTTRLNADLTDYYNQVKLNKKPVKASDYVGECIMIIVNRIINNASFIGYTKDWKDNMVSAGIAGGVIAISKFNPNKPRVNGMSLLWSYIRRGILNALASEKKQEQILSIQASNVHDSFVDSYTVCKYDTKTDYFNKVVSQSTSPILSSDNQY